MRRSAAWGEWSGRMGRAVAVGVDSAAGVPLNQGMKTLAMFGNLGAPELIAICVIALLLFGRRLPEVGRSLGQGIVQFKKGLKDIGDEIETESLKPSQFEAAKTPTTGGQDVRVSQADPVVQQSSSGEGGTTPAPGA